MKKINMKALAEQYEIKPNDMMVYFIIRAMTIKKGVFQEGQKYICDRTNMYQTSVAKSIEKLENLGLVERISEKTSGHIAKLKALDY